MSNNVKSGTNKKADVAAIDSTIHSGRTKIFIQRDFSDGTGIKFQTRFPTELEGRIDRQVFENTINKLNEYFAEAEKSNCGVYCKGCVACLTAYCFQLCMETRYEKCLKKASKYVVEQNEQVYQSRGIFITDPCARGLRVLEIVCLD